MTDNMFPGSDWLLGMEEQAADAYDEALSTAWEALADQVPDGVGWDVVTDDQDRNGAFVFCFEDGGGYEFVATVNPWDDQEYEPNW